MNNKYISPDELDKTYAAFTERYTPEQTAKHMARWAEAKYRIRHGALAELLSAAEALIAYRDKAGSLNFQLEKADDYIRMMRLALAKIEDQS